MDEIVREHEPLDNGICRHCGGRIVTSSASVTCVPRRINKPSRATPPSIFGEPWLIGDRLREIQKEENRDVPPAT